MEVQADGIPTEVPTVQTTLMQTFKAFDYFVSPKLILPEAFGGVKNAVSEMPATLASEFLLECQLGPDERRADLSIFINPDVKQARERFADYAPINARPEVQSAWERIQRFAKDWADPASLLYDALTGVWLELDLDTPAMWSPGATIPNILFRVKPEHQPRPFFEEIVATILGMLVEAQQAALLTQQVMTCYDTLPEGAQIAWVGAMMARPAAPLKLTFSKISPETLPEFLGKLGWQVSSDEVGALALRVLNSLDAYEVALDMGSEGIMQRLGLECHKNQRQLFLEPAWKQFTEDLVERGLCLPDKRDALLKWPGYFFERLAHVEVPNVLNRSLYHVKLIYEPEHALKAKAYLYLSHMPIKQPKPKAPVVESVAESRTEAAEGNEEMGNPGA